MSELCLMHSILKRNVTGEISAILEKTEHNIDFHQIVDFLEASYIRATRIAQSKALSPATDEPASLLGDDRHEEAFFTVSSLDAGHDREKINKTSALPHESSPKVTSLDDDEGSMQQKLQELMELCTSHQRQQEQRKCRAYSKGCSNQRRIMKTGEEVRAEKSTKLGSNETEEMVNVLGSMEAANILISGVAAVSVSHVAGVLAAGVPTVSGSFPTQIRSPIVRAKDKGKQKVVESAVPKKRKFQEQIDAQVAKEMEEEFARENQSNEVIAKHLQEYEQAEAELTVGEKIELINELVKYQDHHAKILKYQAQQSKPLSKKEQREFYMSVLRSHAGWKTKHFRGMTLEEIKEKFIPVKHPIIDWEIHSERKGEYWKIIRLGGHTAVYQFFVDMLKQFDREDLHQLWTLVKETFSIRQATKDKEKELWVELKRLFEPNFKDQLWTHNQAFMHDHLDWKLYDTCGVHHVSTKDHEIFMLVERDYPLRRGLATVMICNKLHVEQYS
nr:hypothetical protein [Tanacetum cinerariifolium]